MAFGGHKHSCVLCQPPSEVRDDSPCKQPTSGCHVSAEAEDIPSSQAAPAAGSAGTERRTAKQQLLGRASHTDSALATTAALQRAVAAQLEATMQMGRAPPRPPSTFLSDQPSSSTANARHQMQPCQVNSKLLLGNPAVHRSFALIVYNITAC